MRNQVYSDVSQLQGDRQKKRKLFPKDNEEMYCTQEIENN